MEPPSAPAASSPVAAAPSPPVTQGPRRRRGGEGGGGEGSSGLREPAGAPACPRSRLACFKVLSSSAGPKSGFCSLEAASQLFPPRIGSGGLGKALPGPQAHPLPLGQRAKPPCRGRPPPPQLPRTLAFPKHRLPLSVRVVLLSIGCALENSSQMIFTAAL